MAAVAQVQARTALALAMVAASNDVHYGGAVKCVINPEAISLRNAGLDPARTVFAGPVTPADYLRRRNAHVYASVPVMRCWSVVAAMATAIANLLADPGRANRGAKAAPDRVLEHVDTARIYPAKTGWFLDLVLGAGAPARRALTSGIRPLASRPSFRFPERIFHANDQSHQSHLSRRRFGNAVSARHKVDPERDHDAG